MSQRRILSTLLSFAAITTSGLIATPRASQASELPTMIAQAESAEAASGSLSVTGTSQISAPAEQALIVLTYYPNSYYAADSSDPNASSQLLQVQPADLQTAVGAITAAGIPAGNVKAFPDFSSPGSMRVRFVLDQPTQDKVEQAIGAANTALAKTGRFTSSGAVVGYAVNNCQAIEAQARQAAMTDAQNRANALAEVAGSQVGRIYSLSESVSWGNSYSPTCPVNGDPTVYSDYYSLPVYDPAVPPLVRLVYTLSVTYDLK